MEASDYQVDIVSVDDVHPSPENDLIYGPIVDDEQMDALKESILKRGLQEPIIVSDDAYIVSGHRRYHACLQLGMETIPVRYSGYSRSDRQGSWPKILSEHNPQRVKTMGALLKESLMRHADEPADLLLRDHREAESYVEAEFVSVEGDKTVKPVSERRQEFLAAAKREIEALRPFWPLSIRQIHYRLLNDPPLKQTPKRPKGSLEKYRYQNDHSSYKALIELLRAARYSGDVPMNVIDDPTRPVFRNAGWASLSQYIDVQVRDFLTDYHRDRQKDQPRHVEVFGEKGTLKTILQPVCHQYYVPLTLGRGYASIPVWRDVASRFRTSGKERMTLIVISDYDPEGLDLADDAIKSLREFGVPADYHRVGVTREQIDELSLNADFNEAKATSARLQGFIDRTGGTETWEAESLPPEFLQRELEDAIEANMNMDIYKATIEQEQRDAEKLAEMRDELVSDLHF